jgi:hypothetical protein
MDVLKIFNLVVCNNKNSSNSGLNFDLLSLFIVPLNILVPNTRFAILAYITIFIFWVLIFSSQSAVVKKITSKDNGLPSWLNALLSAVLLYVFQTVIILLFLKFSICDKTMQWEENDYHLTVQQYSTEDHTLADGY